VGAGVSVNASAKSAHAARGGCSSLTNVTLMDVVSVDFTQLTIMERDGIDQRYCLNIQTTTVASAGAIPAAVASGQVDVGYINSGALASAVQQNLGVKALLPIEDAKDDNNGFYVKASSPITSLKDLVGQTVGLVALDSSAQAALEVNLEKAGVNPSQVKFIAYPLPSIGTGILSGALPVGQLIEPYISQTKAQGAIREIVPTFAVYGVHPPTTYYIVNAAWAAANPGIAARLQQALAQGILAAIRDPSDITALTQLQNPALTPAVVAAQIPPLFSIDPEFTVLNTIWKDMTQVGILPSAPSPYGIFLKPAVVPGGSQNVLWDTAPGQTVNGAAGKNDTIVGFLSHDHLIGGPGTDIIDAVGGDATITAGSGNDTIIAQTGRNVVTCGKGKDTVYATKQDKLKNCTGVHYGPAPQKLLKSLGWGAGGKFPNPNPSLSS
jgi:NitT/TauT family transport system substrate-binding protein